MVNPTVPALLLAAAVGAAPAAVPGQEPFDPKEIERARARFARSRLAR